MNEDFFLDRGTFNIIYAFCFIAILEVVERESLVQIQTNGLNIAIETLPIENSRFAENGHYSVDIDRHMLVHAVFQNDFPEHVWNIEACGQEECDHWQPWIEVKSKTFI